MPETEPTFEELHPEEAMRGRCHKCRKHFEESDANCSVDHKGQAELCLIYYERGEDPEHWRCRSCHAIYDGGMRCTYCGDADPTDTGESGEDEEL